MDEKEKVNAIIDLLGDLRVGGEEIDIPRVAKWEILALVRGGVTIEDWQEGIDIWLKTTKYYGNDYPYLRTCALKTRGKKLAYEAELRNG